MAIETEVENIVRDISTAIGGVNGLGLATSYYNNRQNLLGNIDMTGKPTSEDYYTEDDFENTSINVANEITNINNIVSKIEQSIAGLDAITYNSAMPKSIDAATIDFNTISAAIDTSITTSLATIQQKIEQFGQTDYQYDEFDGTYAPLFTGQSIAIQPPVFDTTGTTDIQRNVDNAFNELGGISFDSNISVGIAPSDLTTVNAPSSAIEDVAIPVFKLGEITVPSNTIDLDAIFGQYETYRENIWESANLQKIYNKTLDWLNGIDVYLSVEYQQNVFDNDRDRRLQALDDGLRTIASRHAARGFRLPTSYLSAQENELLQKYQFDATNSSREINKAVIEAAKEFQRFGAEKGIAIEQVNTQFTTAYNAAILDRLRTILDGHIKSFDLSLRGSELLIKIATTRAELLKMGYDAAISLQKLKTDKKQIEFDIYKTQVGVQISAKELEVKLYQLQVDTQIKEKELELRFTELEINGIVKKAELSSESGKLLFDKNRLDLELYKGKLEGEISKLKMDAEGYDAGLRKWNAELEEHVKDEQMQFEVYKGKKDLLLKETDLSNSEIEAQLKRLQGALSVFEKTIDAALQQKGFDLTAYVKQLEAAQTEINAFVSNQKAYDSVIDAKIKDSQFKLEGLKARLQQYLGDIEAWKTKVNAEATAFKVKADVDSGALISVIQEGSKAVAAATSIQLRTGKITA